MRVALGVPFRSKNPTRILAHEKTWQPRLDLYPWDSVGVFAGDLSAATFNRAAVRNQIVERFCDHDVVVICDADSVPERSPLRKCIEETYRYGGIRFPFDIVDSLGPDGSRAFSYGPSAGGCYVFQPRTWRDLGGMDERLGSWGTDDRSFLVAIETFLGGPVFYPGVLTCHWHSRDSETRRDPEAQRILEEEYLPLLGKPEALRSYLERRR